MDDQLFEGIVVFGVIFVLGWWCVDFDLFFYFSFCCGFVCIVVVVLYQQYFEVRCVV